MAKLLVFLFLAGIAFQANAFSPTVEPDETFDWIPSIFNPFEWVSNIKSIASYITNYFNPLDIISNIATLLNPANWDFNISSILNPFHWDIFSIDFWKPIGKDVTNYLMKFLPNPEEMIKPSYWLKKVVDIYNPFHWLGRFNPLRRLPEPWGWLLGVDSRVCKLRLDKGPCKGLHVRYYYDENTHQCVKFVYGGCKGNGNNFERKKDCVETCIKGQ